MLASQSHDPHRSKAMICGNCGNSVDSIHRFCPKCGASVPAQSPPPPSGSAYTPPTYSAPPTYNTPVLPPKRSSSCGKIIIIGVIIVVLIGVCIAGAIYFGFRYAENKLKSSEAYTVAINTLKENVEVREKLGDIQETGFPIGAYSDNGSTGTAAFVMSVQGTKAKGQYQVELRKTDNTWRVMNGVVKTEDGDTIRVVPSVTIREVPSNTNIPSPPISSDPRARGAISGGVLNGKAISLPKPIYPSAARTVKASGDVVVRVLVDEDGSVINAQAISGHVLLRPAAVAAARQAKFTPTKLAGKPVKVTGIINYTFTPE